MSINIPKNIFDENGNKIIIKNQIGKGGNSKVYECKYNGRVHVIKYFCGSKYKRFKSETKKIKKINNIIPNFTPQVLYEQIPKKYNRLKFNYNTTPYYIMEKGIPYKIDSNKDIDLKTIDIINIANSLKIIHDKKIYHRDLKLDNIIIYKEKITFIDYGTASVPTINTISRAEHMGSIDTIAPEMNNHAKDIPNYDYSKADIYSFGKIIWSILKNDPMSRVFTTYDNQSLRHKIKLADVDETIIMAYEEIIKSCTSEMFNERPTIDEIIKKLIFIRDDLLKDNNKRQKAKFNYIIKQYNYNSVDGIYINSNNNIYFLLNKIKNIFVKIIIMEYENVICSRVDELNIKFRANKNYYFIYNEIEYEFCVSSIEIVNEELLIHTSDLVKENIESEKYYSELDNRDRLMFLKSKIDGETNKILLDNINIVIKKTID